MLNQDIHWVCGLHIIQHLVVIVPVSYQHGCNTKTQNSCYYKGVEFTASARVWILIFTPCAVA